MEHRLSTSALSAGVPAAATARLFYGLMVEAGDLHNGAWLSALIGLALALPVLWLVKRCLEGARGERLRFALLVLLALDAAEVLEGTAYSESCIAFNHVPTAVLMLPLALALGRCLWLGGDAVGAAARIWMWAFLPLLLIVIAMQMPYYRPGWLCPLLGYGMAGILRGGLSAAGWLTAIAGAGMAACDGKIAFARLLRRLSLAATAAALLIVLRLMMAPGTDPALMTRRLRLDSLLTNGRAPLYLQLPMIIMWFVGMLHLLCFEGCLASMLLESIMPRWHPWAGKLLTLLAVGSVALLLPGLRAGSWSLAVVALSVVTGLWPLRKGDKAWAG